MAGLAALAGLAVVLSLGIGSNLIPPAEVARVLLDRDTGEAATVVWAVRMPRTLLGLLVGLAVGAAGALMQGHTRNPLADPGLLGVSGGAALAVVTGVYVARVTDPAVTVWFGLAGALLAAVAVFAIATAGSGVANPVPLALAGAAVSALLTAVTSLLVLADQSTLDIYRRWVVGSLSGRESAVIVDVLPFVLAGLVLAGAGTRGLNALALGEDVARGLGQRVLPTRILGLASRTSPSRKRSPRSPRSRRWRCAAPRPT